MAAGIRPSAMIFHEQPTDPWTPYDFMLLEAYQILQDETCNQCGNPIWVCRSEDPNVTFKIRNSVCFADREFKKWEKSKQKQAERLKKGAWEPEPGEEWYPVAVTVDGGPLPSRNDYLRSLADRME